MRIPQTSYIVLTLSSLSLIGASVILLCTRWGIGLSPDSILYVGAARNLLIGNGLSVPTPSGGFLPLSHFPPLFSISLTAIGNFGIDPLDGARWLNALFFAANIALVGLVVYTSTQSFLLAVLGSFLMVGSLPAVQTHSMAWSEPLFIFFGLLGLYLLALHMEKPRLWVLAASSMAMALSCLARYAGVALLITGVMGLLLWENSWRKRLLDAIIFSSISTTPLFLWVLRNYIVAGTPVNRNMAIHPITSQQLRDAIDTISTWLLPPSVSFNLRWLGLLIVIIMFVSIFVLAPSEAKQNQQRYPDRITRLPPLLGLFILVYGVLLILSISFFDIHTPLNNRILSPVYIAVVTLGLVLSYKMTKLVQIRAIPALLIIICVMFAFSQITQATSWLSLSYKDGLGYASRRWKQSKLMKHIRDLDPQRPVFTNAPDAIYIHTGRVAYMIPTKVNPGTRSLNSNYSSELVQMKRKLGKDKGVLCYFSGIRWRWYLASENELRDELGLSLLVREKDGSIYQTSGREESLPGS